MSAADRTDSFMAQFRCPTGAQGREVAELMNCEHSALTDWGLSHVRVEPSFVVLDVGCGGGRTLQKLANLAFQGRVFGIDYSKDMVEFSNQRNRAQVENGQMQILQGSVDKLVFPSDFFDLVVAVETYYFWSNLSAAFRELNRVLKSGGKLLLINEMILDGKYEIEHAQTIRRAQVHLVALKELAAQLRQAGFSEVEVFCEAGSPWNTLLAKKPP
jgi:SAM-dependent methyltransferase